MYFKKRGHIGLGQLNITPCTPQSRYENVETVLLSLVWLVPHPNPRPHLKVILIVMVMTKNR
jgi:hypothetical protein